jgi:rSAM/selenodomain-associated transferase 2
MILSIIIPTFNEEDTIGRTVEHLKSAFRDDQKSEIIVVDGESSDKTVKIARDAGAVTIRTRKGRAAQMNYGASIASAPILFFLHADTLPPRSFLADISEAISKGYLAGCYRLSFDYRHWFLRFNCWFTRFNLNSFRYGDQGLYVTKQIFETLGGFDETLELMEDQEIIRRIKGLTTFQIFPQSVQTSARKYLLNGIFRLQFSFVVIYLLYKFGFSQQMLVAAYKRLVRDTTASPEHEQPYPHYEPQAELVEKCM